MCVSVEGINMQYLLRILRNRYLLFLVGVIYTRIILSVPDNIESYI